MKVSRPEVRRLIKEIEAAGGVVTRGKSGHYKVYLDGHLVGTLPQTPSDRRGLLNARALLRRAGLQI